VIWLATVHGMNSVKQPYTLLGDSMFVGNVGVTLHCHSCDNPAMKFNLVSFLKYSVAFREFDAEVHRAESFFRSW
jgi:hypothetical protein